MFKSDTDTAAKYELVH